MIDVKNLTVENCEFSGTDGTGPAAGIDFEPDRPSQWLVNCVIRHCVFENNSGHGVLVRYPDPAPRSFTGRIESVSIPFENGISRMDKTVMGGDGGMVVRAPGGGGLQGRGEFIDCTSENTGRAGANVYGSSAGNLKVHFVNCKWKNSGGPAVWIDLKRPSLTRKQGGIEFVNCTVYDTKPRPSALITTDRGGDFHHDLAGTIRVYNKYVSRRKLGAYRYQWRWSLPTDQNQFPGGEKKD